MLLIESILRKTLSENSKRNRNFRWKCINLMKMIWQLFEVGPHCDQTLHTQIIAVNYDFRIYFLWFRVNRMLFRSINVDISGIKTCRPNHLIIKSWLNPTNYILVPRSHYPLQFSGSPYPNDHRYGQRNGLLTLLFNRNTVAFASIDLRRKFVVVLCMFLLLLLFIQKVEKTKIEKSVVRRKSQFLQDQTQIKFQKSSRANMKHIKCHFIDNYTWMSFILSTSCLSMK